MFVRDSEKKRLLELRKDIIFRGWSQCNTSINKIVNSINLQFDDLKHKIDDIQTSLDGKTVSLRSLTKEKEAENQKLKNSIVALKSRTFRPEDDITIETEARLEIEIQNLRKKLKILQKSTDVYQQKSERNKKLFLRTKEKILKEKNKIENNERISKIEIDIQKRMKELQKRIDTEKGLLDNDLKNLQEKLEMFLYPSQHQSIQDKYHSLMLKAGQCSEGIITDVPSVPSNVPYYPRRLEKSLPKNQDNDDSEIPILEQPIHLNIQKERVNTNDSKIQSLQNNINILLSTGVYQETDPLIKDLQMQINALKNN